MTLRATYLETLPLRSDDLSAGQFQEEVDGVSMSSPLSPDIVNFCMEHFDERVLECPPFKIPRC
jgi:hypothetical protein